jgi:hypothetical protein
MGRFSIILFWLATSTPPNLHRPMPNNRDDDRRRPNRDDDDDDRPRRRRQDDDDVIDERDSDRPRRRRDEDDDIDERDSDRPRRRRDYDDDDDRFSRRERQLLSGDDLRSIAKLQKGIMICLLCYVVAIVALVLVRGSPVLLGIDAVFIVIVGITATVFVFLLAMKVYEGATGIILGILSLFCGLIILLIVNQKATSILRSKGVGVGFLGANSDDVEDAVRRMRKRRKKRSAERDEPDDDDDDND